MPQPRSPGPLPTQLAFVVQFAAETAVGRGRFVGASSMWCRARWRISRAWTSCSLACCGC